MRAEHDNDRVTARSGGLAQQRSTLEGPAMSASEFEALKGVIFQHVGVSVTPAKIPLLRARLRVPMQNLGARSFAEYVAHIQERPTQDMVGELADAVTTNHTHFWREPVHFDLFERTVVPELAKRARSQGSNVMRVWCAASSSGQEPYTLAALMMQALDADYGRWDAGVLATDISARALAAAERGTYPSEDIAQLPPVLQRRMFTGGAGGVFSIRPEVQREVTFRRLNLVSTPFRFKRPFDVVFCRNVMIYFDDATRNEVVKKLAEIIRPGGYLFVGLAESLGMPKWFQQIAPSFYRRNEVR